MKTRIAFVVIVIAWTTLLTVSLLTTSNRLIQLQLGEVKAQQLAHKLKRLCHAELNHTQPHGYEIICN